MLRTTGVRGVPLGVVRAGDAGQREAEAAVGTALAAPVGHVEDADLRGDVLIRHVAQLAVRDDMEVHGHRRGEVGRCLAARGCGHRIGNLAGVLLPDHAFAVGDAAAGDDARLARRTTNGTGGAA